MTIQQEPPEPDIGREPDVGREVARFAELVAALREGCPWDREQTHRSLTRHLLEESYEVIDAIEALDEDSGEGYDHLEEELGDLLFQVAFHSTLAAERDQFTLADVARNVHDKLRARHPHVFGDVEVADADEVVSNWEQIKKAEKGRESVFDGMPKHLPALLYALKVQKKAATLAEAGVEIDPAPDLSSSVDALLSSPTPETLAAVLYAAVDVARQQGVDPESSLRALTTHRLNKAKTSEP